MQHIMQIKASKLLHLVLNIVSQPLFQWHITSHYPDGQLTSHNVKQHMHGSKHVFSHVFAGVNLGRPELRVPHKKLVQQAIHITARALRRDPATMGAENVWVSSSWLAQT
jgi:hypothetical protein